MSENKLVLPLLACCCALATAPVPSIAQESGVAYDSNTGNYIITYRSEYEPHSVEQVTWIPATKIAPVVRSSVRPGENGQIIYGYEIANSTTSQQNLAGLNVHINSAIGAASKPDSWYGAIVPFFRTGQGNNAGWFYNGPKTLGGIEPGHRLKGFGFESLDLAGVQRMQLSGATPPDQGFPGGNPEADPAVGDNLEVLIAHNYVARYAAVPWIAVPSPFVAAPVLTALQKHVDQDLVTMKLIDPSLVSVMDPLFQSAIAAAQDGNSDALRGDLRALRRAVSDERGQEEKAENADDACEVEDRGEKAGLSPTRPIAKIARQVLDFDFKYIEHAVKPGHDASDK